MTATRRALVAVLTVAAVTAAPLTTIDTVATPTHPHGRDPAEPPTWFALGDSYSSGEGIPDSDLSTPAGSRCQRATGDTSARAYAVVAYEKLWGRDARRDFQALTACTGNLAHDADSQLAEAATTLGADKADVVSFSFGGNDIGFSPLLFDCIGIPDGEGENDLFPLWEKLFFNPGCEVTLDELRRRIDILAGKQPSSPPYYGKRSLPDLYASVANRVKPGGHVFVHGYPRLVESHEKWKFSRAWLVIPPNCHGIIGWDADLFRAAGDYLNEAIWTAVRDADRKYHGVRFHYIDVARVYENDDGRHGLCSQDPWLNGLQVVQDTEFRIQRSFHPHQAGHTATGNFLADYITKNAPDLNPGKTGYIAAKPAVAFLHQSNSILSLLDPANGAVRTLATASARQQPSVPAYPLRWSPDGRRLAGLSADGQVTVWNIDGSPARRLNPCGLPWRSGAPWGCTYDIVFTNSNTLAALEGPSVRDLMGWDRGIRLVYYDLTTGRRIRTVPIRPITGLVGQSLDGGSLLAIDAKPRTPRLLGDELPPIDLVWLNQAGNVTRRVAVGLGCWVESATLSPGRRQVAVLRSCGGPSSVLAVVDVETGRITEADNPFAEARGYALDGVRWSDQGTLLMQAYNFDLAPPTGMVAYHRGRWHIVDKNEVHAAMSIGDNLQVVAVNDRDPANVGGELYLLRGRPYGPAGDVFAQPGSGAKPLARDVSGVWFSPAGREHPFRLPSPVGNAAGRCAQATAAYLFRLDPPALGVPFRTVKCLDRYAFASTASVPRHDGDRNVASFIYDAGYWRPTGPKGYGDVYCGIIPPHVWRAWGQSCRGDARVCGTQRAARGYPRLVSVETGSTTCQTALGIVKRYFDDGSVRHEGSGAFAQIEGWWCGTPSGTGTSYSGIYATCEKPGGTIRVNRP